MKKSERISQQVAALVPAAEPGLEPCYAGYFLCFNAGQYYEAHDVLEHLWLENRDENAAFYKGLIQIAGAFVHLQKQFTRPEHPKDGRRLRPAVRLFELGQRNLEPYGSRHLRLDLESLRSLCRRLTDEIVDSDFTRNPWQPERLPQLSLEAL